MPKNNHSLSSNEELTFTVLDEKETSENSLTWILDSGATAHICHEKSAFNNLEPQSGTTIEVASGDKIEVEGIGDIWIKVKDNNNETLKIKIERVLYVPKASKNLMSIRSITRNGHTAQFTENGVEIKIKGSDRLIYVEETGRLFMLNCKIDKANEYASATTSIKEESLDTWHNRLGHPSNRMIVKLQDSVDGMKLKKENTKITDCETCIATKLEKIPFQSSERLAQKPLELVHSDVLGPMRMPTAIEGHFYAVSFIDDYSRYCQVYTMKHKSETLDKFKEFVANNGQPETLEVKGI
jgi:hypothetical protein